MVDTEDVLRRGRRWFAKCQDGPAVGVERKERLDWSVEAAASGRRYFWLQF